MSKIDYNKFYLQIILLLVVQNSGVIRGVFMNNGAVNCGNLVCRSISGIFSKTDLPIGYTHVAVIPYGASNISITEMKHSINNLVLKTSDGKYIINGDNTISMSGPYDAVGTTVDYRRIDGLTNSSSSGYRKIEGITEWITSTGPTTEPLFLMVLVKQPLNPGIKYEYLLPIHPNIITNSEEEIESDVTSSELESELATKLKSGTISTTPINVTTKPVRRKRQFLWKVIGFNSCSKSCGGGIQQPLVKCVREAPTRIFSPKRCAHLKQPVLNELMLKCNNQPCPAYWRIGEWNECICNGNSEEEHQSRDLKCVQELGSGLIIQVNHGACVDDVPLSRKKCECPKYMKTQIEVHKHAKPHHHSHGEFNASSSIQNLRIPKLNQTRVIIEENKKQGIWLTSDWNQQCTAECGNGIQYRTIFCDRSPPNIERCDMRFTPETTRQCNVADVCEFGKWFAGPWSDCKGDCFNLKKSRQIYCIKSDIIVLDSECRLDEKPDTTLKCQPENVHDCRPKWHFSEWTTCSKGCNAGTQKRTVKCYEPDTNENQLKESPNCKFAERPTGYSECNTHSCSDESTTEKDRAKNDITQNDISLDCKDQYPNCHLVRKARLCNYAYYYEQCCYSCQILKYNF